MKIIAYILLFFLLQSTQGLAQEYSFVGMEKEEVKELISKEHKKFSFDNTVVKQQFNYLKYVNGPQTITWIFYFSDKDICTSTKMVCDYTEYDFILQDLDEQYEKVDLNMWEFQIDAKSYTLTLEELDWYFTLREKKKSNR